MIKKEIKNAFLDKNIKIIDKLSSKEIIKALMRQKNEKNAQKCSQVWILLT